MNKLEAIFFQVLSDLKEYLENLTLVGGWVPYIYAKYLWKESKVMPIGTIDIDIGVGKKIAKIPSQTIYERLHTKYKHRHLRMDREYEVKKAKDLYYMYYVLRFCPDIAKVLKEINKFRKEKIFKDFQENIKSHFEHISSEGCLLVERENGPDDYIDNLRKDIFERVKPLYEI